MKRLVQVGPALNAYKFTFDDNLLDELRRLYFSALSHGLAAPQNASIFEGGAQISLSISVANYKFHLLSYGKTPLLWVSSGNRPAYDIFKRFADSLEIENDLKELVDCNQNLVMYSGFFVVGNRLPVENWHLDYDDGANAYTLITPLFELDRSHGHLLYKDTAGNVQTYRYKRHKAIVFGDRFPHGTECYSKSPIIRALVSFTIGTDKPEYWNVLRHTIGNQGNFMYLPCGHERGTCDCCKEA